MSPVVPGATLSTNIDRMSFLGFRAFIHTPKYRRDSVCGCADYSFSFGFPDSGINPSSSSGLVDAYSLTDPKSSPRNFVFRTTFNFITPGLNEAAENITLA